MASAANLRSRRSVAELAALAGVEREIRTQDSTGRRKYLQDYTRAFRTYESVLDGEALKAAARAADIVLIGDYHALPASQLFAASLLEERAQPADRPVVLGVETIFARDQHVLDEWWRREISEREFRQRIRFDIDWGYDWGPFYALWWPLGNTEKPFMASTVCREKTCARSALVIATPHTRSRKFVNDIRVQWFLSCSASRTWHRHIFRARYGNSFRANGS